MYGLEAMQLISHARSTWIFHESRTTTFLSMAHEPSTYSMHGPQSKDQIHIASIEEHVNEAENWQGAEWN